MALSEADRAAAVERFADAREELGMSRRIDDPDQLRLVRAVMESDRHHANEKGA